MLFAVGVCGILGFYDSLFGFGDLMRLVNSAILILLSVGLLVRAWAKTKLRKTELLTERNAELEKQLELMNLRLKAMEKVADKAGSIVH
jgi:predicted homoserine dehydrogenase-like protein